MVAILALSLVFLNGCANTQTTGQGVLALSITDAASDLNISEALVTISDIQVHKVLANETNETNDTWITVSSESQTFNLIDLIDARDVLGNVSLDTGKYTQIRLTVVSAIVTINGTEYNLTVPSDKIKIVRNFDIIEGNVTDLTLDFDLFESIHQAGTEYILNPTIKLLNEAEYQSRETKQNKCNAAGGNIEVSKCCNSSDDFPNSCTIGACGCSNENSKHVKTCKCQENKCFNGETCI